MATTTHSDGVHIGDADPEHSGRNLEELLSPSRWVPRHRADPELRKALGVIQTRLSETRRLLALSTAEATLRDAAAVRELTSLVQSEPATLDIDGAWELGAALERLNLRFADREFLTSRLEFELRRASLPDNWHGWNTHFEARELLDLVEAFKEGRATTADQARAVDRLAFLYAQRAEVGRARRKRYRDAWRRTRNRLLAATVVAVGVSLVVALVLIDIRDLWKAAGWTVIVSVAAAAMLAVPLQFDLRDRLVTLDDLRSWGPRVRLLAALAPLMVVALAVALASVHAAGIRLSEENRSTSGLVVAICAFAFVIPIIGITGFWRRWIFWRRSWDETLISATVGSLVAIVALTELFAVLTVALISYGKVDPGNRAAVPLGIVEHYYGWKLADALPVLEIPKTLNWAQPIAFHDHVAGTLLLAYKLLVILPIAGFVARVVAAFRAEPAIAGDDEGNPPGRTTAPAN